MPPTRTDALAATDLPRGLIAAAIVALVWIGFQPFDTGEVVGQTAGASGGGNATNQIGFGLLGLLCVWLVTQLDAARRAALLRPAWIVVGVLLLTATLTADAPPSAFRAALFSAIVVLCAGVAVALPRSMDEMTATLGWGGLAALLFSLVAVFLLPEKGVHDGGGFEAQHAGLWRGVYAHKNVAAYVAGAFVILGLFVARNGRALLGLTLAGLGTLFVLGAGSKTVLGILPAALLVGWLAARASWSPLRFILVLLPLAILATVTLGTALSESANDLLQDIAPGTTFTGRLDLWRYTVEAIGKAPWGYGFESFWSTPRVTQAEQPIELSWDVRKIVHAHSSYLDAAVTFGVAGGLVLIALLTLRPAWHFARIPAKGTPNRLAEMWVTLWLFTAMGGCLESFFLRRSDPVWFAMALSLFGLQVTHAMTRGRR